MKGLLRSPSLHLFLAALVVLQLGLIAIVFWPRTVSGGGGVPLFSDVSADDIVQVTISDDTGKTVRLAFDNGEWALPDAGWDSPGHQGASNWHNRG